MAAEKGEQAVRPIPGGFVLWGGGTKEKPWEEGALLRDGPTTRRPR